MIAYRHFDGRDTCAAAVEPNMKNYSVAPHVTRDDVDDFTPLG
jgi:hypothetical protein